MIVKYDPALLQKLKKVNVRVRKHFKERLDIFIQDPFNSELNNHPLQREYAGYRSIDITNDWRAVYTEKREGDDVIAFFVTLGIHDELYKKEATVAEQELRGKE